MKDNVRKHGKSKESKKGNEKSDKGRNKEMYKAMRLEKKKKR